MAIFSYIHFWISVKNFLLIASTHVLNIAPRGLPSMFDIIIYLSVKTNKRRRCSIVATSVRMLKIITKLFFLGNELKQPTIRIPNSPAIHVFETDVCIYNSSLWWLLFVLDCTVQHFLCAFRPSHFMHTVAISVVELAPLPGLLCARRCRFCWFCSHCGQWKVFQRRLTE